MTKTVYLKLNQITELHVKDVALKDVAEVYCEDKNIQNKCNAMKVKPMIRLYRCSAKRRF